MGLHLGLGAGNAQLDEFGSPGGRLALDQLIGGTVADHELVEAELVVGLDLGEGGQSAYGLEVDDHDVAIGIEFEAVSSTLEFHALGVWQGDGGGEFLLGGQNFTPAWCFMPLGQAHQRQPHLLALTLA